MTERLAGTRAGRVTMAAIAVWAAAGCASAGDVTQSDSALTTSEEASASEGAGGDGVPGEGSAECGGSIPDTVILDVPWVGQMPELARGCEVTSLAMMLRHAGFDADKMSLAAEIDRVPYAKDGLSGNPNDGFVGDMNTFSQPGYGVYHAPVARLAKRYLGERALDLTGIGFNDLLGQHVARRRPVWVVTNATFKKLPDASLATWHTSSGDVRITWHEHSVLVTGYEPDFVYINDPLDAHRNKKLSRKDFAEAWEQMGSQAISYENCGSPKALPGGTCGVRTDGRLYCDNRANTPMYEKHEASSKVVNHLRSSFSWFSCWGTGEKHAGGNTTWYRTVGDDNLTAGWIPGVMLKTPDAFDTDPTLAGLPRCEEPEEPPVDGGL